MKCVSCKREFKKGALFQCPSCQKETVARCSECKKKATAYKCGCGFEGP